MNIEDRVDCMGIPLKEGDMVVFALSYYADIHIGIVNGFTLEKVKITGLNSDVTCTKFPQQIASVEANKEVSPEFFL